MEQAREGKAPVLEEAWEAEEAGEVKKAVSVQGLGEIVSARIVVKRSPTR